MSCNHGSSLQFLSVRTAGIFRSTKAENPEGVGILVSFSFQPVGVQADSKEERQYTYNTTLWQSRVMFVSLAAVITWYHFTRTDGFNGDLTYQATI
jgi:hypothetical protein